MTDKEKALLWEKYIKTRDLKLREQLIVEYSPLVKIVAGRLSMYLGNNVEYDDLVGFGVLGLIDSVDKFNTSLNVKFETYASIRIRGSIIDQIRKLDWIPRSIRSKQKTYNDAENSLYIKFGRKPTDNEMITELKVTEDEYYLTQSKLLGTNLVYIDDNSTNSGDKDKYSISETLEQTTFINPERSILKEELSEKLKYALGKLTDKERKVVELYYYEELTLKEIANIMEVTESRVSQLHTKAICKLKSHLGEYMDLFYKSV